MVDLHCHILPGVDDGAADPADALDMARAAIDQGCKAVCATSHLWEGLFGTSPETNDREYHALVRLFEREGIPLQVFHGAENYLANAEAPEVFAEKAVALGEAGRYVLFDFSMQAVPRNLEAAISALADHGRTALIAHPERNAELQRDPTPVATWIERGARIQVNAPSLLGRHGRDARDAADELLEAGAAHVVASDAHGMRRPFCLGEAHAVLAERFDREFADRLCRENPWRVVRGESLEASPVKLTRRNAAARFLRRLQGD